MKIMPGKLARAAAYFRAEHERAEARGDHAESERCLASAVRHELLLQAHGCCQRCGRTLSDPESVARGLGPECVRKAS